MRSSECSSLERPARRAERQRLRSRSGKRSPSVTTPLTGSSRGEQRRRSRRPAGDVRCPDHAACRCGGSGSRSGGSRPRRSSRPGDGQQQLVGDAVLVRGPPRAPRCGSAWRRARIAASIASSGRSRPCRWGTAQGGARASNVARLIAESESASPQTRSGKPTDRGQVPRATVRADQPATLGPAESRVQRAARADRPRRRRRSPRSDSGSDK